MRLTTSSKDERSAFKLTVVRTLTVAAMAISMVALPTSSAQATTPNVQALLDHYTHCLGLLLTNPAAHSKECGPNTMPDSNKSLSEPVIGPPPVKLECTSGSHEAGGQCVPDEPACEQQCECENSENQKCEDRRT